MDYNAGLSLEVIKVCHQSLHHLLSRLYVVSSDLLILFQYCGDKHGQILRLLLLHLPNQLLGWLLEAAIVKLSSFLPLFFGAAFAAFFLTFLGIIRVFSSEAL